MRGSTTRSEGLALGVLLILSVLLEEGRQKGEERGGRRTQTQLWPCEESLCIDSMELPAAMAEKRCVMRGRGR